MLELAISWSETIVKMCGTVAESTCAIESERLSVGVIP